MKTIGAGIIALLVAVCPQRLGAQSDGVSVEDTLIGDWTVQIGNYNDRWSFNADGHVASMKEAKLRGSWKKESNCILIQWEAVEQGCHPWEALTLPLNPQGTRGGNWCGLRVMAKKTTGSGESSSTRSAPSRATGAESQDNRAGKLKQLLDQGLITQEQYDDKLRRMVIRSQ